RESELFRELETLVLDYAVGMSVTPVDVSDELFAALREPFDDAQLVELTSVIAVENLRGRFNLALGIGAAGFSEGMVCAVPETRPTSNGEPAQPSAGAFAAGAFAAGAPAAGASAAEAPAGGAQARVAHGG